MTFHGGKGGNESHIHQTSLTSYNIQRRFTTQNKLRMLLHRFRPLVSSTSSCSGNRSVRTTVSSLRQLLVRRHEGNPMRKLHSTNQLLWNMSSQRFFSSSSASAASESAIDSINIYYASQGGTSQLFAHQLAEGIEEEVAAAAAASVDTAGTIPVDIKSLDEQSPENFLEQFAATNKNLHFFLVSCAGVGEPPDNGREFYNYFISSTTTKDGGSNDISPLPNFRYAVFGLGNQRAHPNHYNVIGKRLNERFQKLGAQQLLPLGLGDDGDCIDDDFDQWMEQTLEFIQKTLSSKEETNSILSEAGTTATTSDDHESPAEADVLEADYGGDDRKTINEQRIECPAGIATSPDGTRRMSLKYPPLLLEPATRDVVSADLFHLQNGKQQFYSKETLPLTVRNNRLLTTDSGESGLLEIEVDILGREGGTFLHGNNEDLSYTTGDHLLVYPRNSNAIVQGYVDILDVDPHARIVNGSNDSYPHPTGISIMETLVHCIDLGALPSPALSRFILGRKTVDYKREIAEPRRTIIDLLHETGTKLSLEDFLYMATPMRPRYYSIASSSVKHPSEIQLTYRPVKYMTSKGYLREGVCTSFLSHKGAMQQQSKDGESPKIQASRIPASIVRNDSFRLPINPETPVLMIGGGCGVAPIKAFLQERVFQSGTQQYGPGILFMGYRNPQDEVYKDLVHQAMTTGALTESKVVYSSGCSSPDQRCMMVSELVKEEGEKVWNHFESGGHTYLCGGAWNFGTAIKAELLEIVQAHGNMDFEAAEQYLRNLSDQQKLSADLAD
eukprot:scaffold3359_cov123-Cylindrotheca_fusiformis.AAC.16